jgi:methylated-DNA-protein-cysteine methyltransferase-like protein
MRACPDDVPWHRVVNSRGALSLAAAHGGVNLQRALLEGEGVEFDARGRIDLQVHGWKPPPAQVRQEMSGQAAMSKRKTGT